MSDWILLRDFNRHFELLRRLLNRFRQIKGSRDFKLRILSSLGREQQGPEFEEAETSFIEHHNNAVFDDDGPSSSVSSAGSESEEDSRTRSSSDVSSSDSSSTSSSDIDGDSRSRSSSNASANSRSFESSSTSTSDMLSSETDDSDSDGSNSTIPDANERNNIGEVPCTSTTESDFELVVSNFFCLKITHNSPNRLGNNNYYKEDVPE